MVLFFDSLAEKEREEIVRRRHDDMVGGPSRELKRKIDSRKQIEERKDKKRSRVVGRDGKRRG